MADEEDRKNQELEEPTEPERDEGVEPVMAGVPWADILGSLVRGTGTIILGEALTLFVLSGVRAPARTAGTTRTAHLKWEQRSQEIRAAADASTPAAQKEVQR